MSEVRPSPCAQSLHRGVLFGLGAGFLGGVAWYVVVLGTTSMTAYLIPVLGVGVAYGVHRGMRRAGALASCVSVAVTAVTVALAVYFVERHLVMKWFSDAGDVQHIPLVPYLDWVAAVLRHAFHKGPAAAAYSLLALAASGWFGYRGFTAHDFWRRTPVGRQR